MHHQLEQHLGLLWRHWSDHESGSGRCAVADTHRGWFTVSCGSDRSCARRFLDLSGIDTEELRLRAAEPALLAALLHFLEAHEPDLIDVADAMGVRPAELVAAREDLEA